MLPPPYAVGLSGFDYHELDERAVSLSRPNSKLVNWYNCQFYNGWGDASSQDFYNSVAVLGEWDPSRIVLGVLDNAGNGGSGFVSSSKLVEVIRQLRTNYPTFGGVIGWEYFNAGASDGLGDRPWDWVKTMSNALYNSYSPRRVDLITSLIPNLPSPWPDALKNLTGEGARYFDAVRALNITDGNLGSARNLLFPP
ncbi:hypothetical protein ABW20_dc0102542 [Dactylellina cionopaga]|nr:hypothetical protein ABW20_dc0102542 [Dactylellina cionopaga]